MIQSSFWEALQKVVVPTIKEHQKVYLHSIHKEKRLHYQQGKVIEELGEMVQALVAENFAKKSYSSYEEIRGTFESEASDVIIASLSYLILAKRKIDYSYDNFGCSGEATIFLYKCVLTVGGDNFARLIALIHNFCEDTGIDILHHIRSRVSFNSGIVEELKKEVNKNESKEK